MRSSTRAGVKDALVLVRESWGSELLVRLWALGVSRPAAEHYYRAIDPCVLEQTIAAWSTSTRIPSRRWRRWSRWSSDSVRLVRSPSQSIRRCGGCRGSSTPQRAMERLAEDAAGFTLFPPNAALAAHRMCDSCVTFTVVTACCCGLRRSRYTCSSRPSPAVGAVPQFYPVRIDSLWAAWRRSQ